MSCDLAQSNHEGVYVLPGGRFPLFFFYLFWFLVKLWKARTHMHNMVSWTGVKMTRVSGVQTVLPFCFFLCLFCNSLILFLFPFLSLSLSLWSGGRPADGWMDVIDDVYFSVVAV